MAPMIQHYHRASMHYTALIHHEEGP
jgi:hypothetical protein